MSHDAIEILLCCGGLVATLLAYRVGWRKGRDKAIAFEHPTPADAAPVPEPPHPPRRGLT